MSVFNSVGTPLVVLMVILMVGGAIFGTAVSGADYLNPAASRAEANRTLVENSHQQIIYQESERLTKVQTDAQIRTIESEQKAAEQQIEMNLNYQQQRNEKRLAAYEKLMNVLTSIIWVVGIAAGMVLVLVLGLFLGSKAIVPIRTNKLPHHSVDATNAQSPAPAVDAWQSPEFREQMLKIARNNEAAIRQAILTASMSKEQWEKLPRAE